MLESIEKPKTLVVLQPGYLPWLGFFNQLYESDIFVYYDDVQYDKHGWRNRNRIKSPQGPAWLTVPVLHRGLGKPRIMDIEINNDSNWARKHLGTIRQYYAKAPHFQNYFSELEPLLSRPWKWLIDLNLTTTDWLCQKIALSRTVHRASELNIDGGQTERLVRLCQHFGVSQYLSGKAAQDYLEVDQFTAVNITVKWQTFEPKPYPQLHGDHVPFLSLLDALFNVGGDSLQYIR